jgi:hypothetical protein
MMSLSGTVWGWWFYPTPTSTSIADTALHAQDHEGADAEEFELTTFNRQSDTCSNLTELLDSVLSALEEPECIADDSDPRDNSPQRSKSMLNLATRPTL